MRGTIVAATLAAGIVAAPAAAGFGPMVWSPDGELVVAWHRARIAAMPLVETKEIWRTDTIAPPPAVAVSWSDSTLFVPAPDAPLRVDLYRPGDPMPAASLVGFPGPVTALAILGGRLLASGPGFCDSRGAPDGAWIDSLRWSPPMAPLALAPTTGGCILLLEDRLVLIDEGPTFASLPGGGRGVALADRGGAPALLLDREGALTLTSLAGDGRPVVRLDPGERAVGADVTADGRFAALVIAERGDPKGAANRVAVIDLGTGETVKKLRSALIRGSRKEFELPVALSFDPSGAHLAVSWPSSGTQIWTVEGWDLLSLY